MADKTFEEALTQLEEIVIKSAGICSLREVIQVVQVILSTAVFITIPAPHALVIPT